MISKIMILDLRPLKHGSYLYKFYKYLVFLTIRIALCHNLLEKFLFKVNIRPKNNF